MDLPNKIKLADQVWLSIVPHLDDQDLSVVAKKLHAVFTEHGHDLDDTRLSAFAIGAKITLTAEF
jgi:hypothetical protein